MTIDWQLVQVPFGGGVDQQRDPRLVNPPNAAILNNAVFDDMGGYQTRLPFVARSATDTSGVAITDIRKLVPYGDELLLFSKEKIYSWSELGEAWKPICTYLAPKLTEEALFIRTADQDQCDMVRTPNVTLYAWLDSATALGVYVAAMDPVTGAVLLAPTLVQATTGERPRLVWRSGWTRALLFCETATNTLSVKAIDPTSVTTLASTVAGGWTTVSTAYDGFYDAISISSTLAFVCYGHTTATTYGYASVSNAATPVVSANTKARDAFSLIACAVSPDNTRIAVIRNQDATGNNVRADLLNASTFADVSTTLTIGTIPNNTTRQVACEFRSVTDGGFYRCYVYFGTQTNNESDDSTQLNWVDTNGAVGTAAVFVRRAIPASRAFDHGGKTFCWFVFAHDSTQTGMTVSVKTSLQNTYFLMRDDGELVAKAAMNYAGGYQPVTSYLPQVQLDPNAANTYAFLGQERRRISNATSGLYADRGPREIAVTFDSDEARRCVQLGKTLYVSGGQILQFDGEGIAEVGFHIHPWYIDVLSIGGGSLEAGTHQWSGSLNWQNMKGEYERSTTAAYEELTVTAGQKAAMSIIPLYMTRKQSQAPYLRTPPAYEIWRTLKNPPDGAPRYLTNSKIPSSLSGANCYIANDPTTAFLPTYEDSWDDDTLDGKEQHPENGAVLENLAPPAATIILASHERLILAGISHDPNELWYSKQRGNGEIAAFHDSLVVQLPAYGGKITALAYNGQTLTVFKERAIYALPGDGFDNSQEGSNLGPPQLISSDIGCASHDLVATTTSGIFFKSQQGWYSLDRGWNLQYVGGPIEDYDGDTWKAVVVIESKHQIRCVSTSRIMMFDWTADEGRGAWSEWEEAGAVTSCFWGVSDTGTYGPHWYATNTAVKREKLAHGTDVTYSLSWKSAPFFLGDVLLGANHIKEIGILGEYKSAHDLEVKLFKNYESTAFQTKQWTVTPAATGPEIARHRPSQRRMAAIQIQLTPKAVGGGGAPTGEALKLVGVTLKLGIERGLHKVQAAQKQ